MRVGVGLREFWDLTPAELDLLIDAWNWQQSRRMDLALATGWANAACARMYADGALPPLQEFLDELRSATPPAPPASAEELARKFRWLHALMGGDA